MTQARGVSLLEVLIAVAIMALLTGLMVVPAYTSYARSRAASDAAATLAQDLSLLERVAQNGGSLGGATLLVESASPFAYAAYGRRSLPSAPISPGVALLRRSFPGVALAGGPIDTSTPLLFARNGSAQYYAAGKWADQHQTVEIVLAPAGSGHSARVDVQLFTGAVTVP